MHCRQLCSGRNSCLTQWNSSGTGTGMYYNRDVADRIAYREKDTIITWNWALTGQWFYAYTGTGDTPDFIRDASWNIVEQDLQLPGGITLSINPQATGNAQKQYSLPNIHGDILLILNAAGTNTSTGAGPLSSYLYDPFGNAANSTNLPANTVSGSYGPLGENEKITEINMSLLPVQMGARVYIPGIGRFTSIDPIEGGTDNNYAYANDPVNNYDLTGQAQKGWDSRQYKNYSQKELDTARNRSLGKDYSKSDYNSYKKTTEYNQKVWERSRNEQKRKDNNRRGGGSPPLPPMAPYPLKGSQPNGGAAKIIIGGGAAGGIIWWAFKVASPVCGPAAPACAIAF